MEKIIPDGFFSQLENQTVTKEDPKDRIPFEWEKPIEWEDDSKTTDDKDIILLRNINLYSKKIVIFYYYF